MKKLKPREWLLILFPTLLLLGALMTQLRPDATRAVLWRFFPPHRFYVEKFEFETLTPYEVFHGYDTKVLVILNYGGSRPAWWNKQSTFISPQLDEQLIQQNGAARKAIRKNIVQAGEPQYDLKRDRYISTYFLHLSKIPRSESAVWLRSKNGVGIWRNKLQSAVVPFEIVVRAPQQTVAPPKVLQRPALRVERVLVTYLSAAESKTIFNYDVRVRVVFRRDTKVPVFEGNIGSNFSLSDEKGKELSNISGSNGGLADAFTSYEDDVKSVRPDTLYFEDYRFSFGKNPPPKVVLSSWQALKGTWPLLYKTVVPTPHDKTSNRKKSRTIEAAFTQRVAPQP